MKHTIWLGLLLIFSGLGAHGQWQGRKTGTAGIQKIHWPLVYPERYKLAVAAGLSQNRSLIGPSPGLAFGLSGELLFFQTFFAGLGWEMNRVGAGDTLTGATLHRIALHGGFIVPLGKSERHHLTAILRPGIGIIRAETGSGAGVGISYGLGYEFGINSDFILSPEMVWHRYGSVSKSIYGLSGWTFGLRLSFGR